MIKYLFFSLCFSWLLAADLLIDIPSYAHGYISGKEYLISKDTLYCKMDVYRSVYKLPKTIKAARFKDKSIETPEYTLYLDKIIKVKEFKQKLVSTLTNVEVAVPVTIIATANNAVIVAYDGLQLARVNGDFLKLLSLETVSADQLEQLRLTFLNQKQNNLSRSDRQYVRLLYRLESEKRREGLHDQYAVSVPQ